jgi:WD40 repeat protein
MPASPSAVFSVAFSPDGRTLAAGTHDGHVRLWDTSTREPLGTPLSADSDLVGGGFRRAAWDHFAPGIAYQDDCR